MVYISNIQLTNHKGVTMKQTINQSTFDCIWEVIKDRYNVGNWMTCSMSKIDRSERLEIKMQDAFNLIESITLSLVEKNASSIDFEDGVPQLKTHPLNKDGYTTITKSVQNKNLYEIYDVGDSDVGFEVGDLVDGRLVQVVNNTLKIDGKCLVKVHQHSCGRYPQNRTQDSWRYCSPQSHIWNRPSCNSRHSNNEVK